MSRSTTARPATHSGRQKVTLLVLALLALACVFVLPALVEEPWLLDDTGTGPAAPPPGAAAVTPSRIAEKTRYRQDAQAVLGQIIAIRDTLRARQVQLWGEAEFNQALGAVAEGDELYGFGEYEAALVRYRQALASLQSQEERGRQLLATSLQEGVAAIEALNLNVAVKSEALAQALAPDDAEVRTLARRLAALPEVTELLEAGDRSRADGALDAAREAYRSAVALDPLHQRAATSLGTIESEITDRRFRRHMSRGFELLDQGGYEGARAAFRAAGSVYPGNAAVTRAMEQVDNRQSQDRVSMQLNRAGDHESSEDWQQAVEVYEALLEQDPTLTQARVRIIPARVRAELDSRLQKFIDDPLSLSNPSGYRAGQLALDDARGINGPGPRLGKQIEALEELLVLAVSAVDVEFRSDNLTHVTLYRVAELGRFTQTSVRLRPGRYIAAGKRQGFRDVRVEFTVTGKPPDSPIVVQCEDPI